MPPAPVPVLLLQLADLPEQVGQYSYWTVTNPHGQDTVMRRVGQAGHEQVVLSAATLQADAHKLSDLLGLSVAGMISYLNSAVMNAYDSLGLRCCKDWLCTNAPGIHVAAHVACTWTQRVVPYGSSFIGLLGLLVAFCGVLHVYQVIMLVD